MFQAAFALTLGARFGVRPCFIDIAASARVQRRWGLDAFGLHAVKLSPVASSLVQYAVAGLSSACRLAPIPFVLIEQDVSRLHCVVRPPRMIYGYWQRPDYFAQDADMVRRTFCLSRIADTSTATMIKAKEAPVAIHVRRGDYVKDAASRNLHLVCSKQWYRLAWDSLRAEVPAAYAFVFSDDPAWCQRELGLDPPVLYMPHDPKAHPAHDMALMSACRHYIISNSSYSWWAAWLGGVPDALVIAPGQWFRGIDTRSLEICPATWRLM